MPLLPNPWSGAKSSVFFVACYLLLSLPWWLSKESACDAGDPGSFSGSGRSPGGKNGNSLSILAWRIPRIEEPGGL